MNNDRLVRAVEAIDEANADDPETIVVRSERRPKEQAHAELMTEWVRRLDPKATDEQLLAARAHHLRRWATPRSSYPEGRAGYLRWRTSLGRQHAEDVGRILATVGFDGASIERVQQIIRKERRTTDAAVQTHEDALCLVFLETQLHDLVDRLGEDKAIDVVAKTLRKMSEPGIEAALGLPLRARDRALVDRAMSAAEKP